MFDAEKGSAERCDGGDLHIGLVQARFNENITDALADACRERELPNTVSFDANSRLFSPFVSPDHDTARDRERGGVGLGLAIAERAVRCHGGTIAARNASEGLLVEITLPLGGAFASSPGQGRSGA